MPGPSGPGTGAPGSPSTPTPGSPGVSDRWRSVPPRRSDRRSRERPDLTTWEFWWGFNKDQYLNLKAHIHSGGVSTDGDDFFSSQGSKDKAKNTLKPSEETIRAMVVPMLKDVLANERHNDIVTGAMVALGKIGDVTTEDGKSEFELIISKFLADPSQEIAETAAVALGILANDASVAKLKDLALDTTNGRKLVGSTEVRYRTRAFATYGLGLIGARSGRNDVRQDIARILIELILSPDSSTRDIKVAAVVALGLTPIDLDPSENPEGVADNSASRQTQLRFLQRFYLDQKNHYMIRAHVPTAMARLLVGAPAGTKDDLAALFLEALDVNSKEKDEIRRAACSRWA
jgi:hypothetical protein